MRQTVIKNIATGISKKLKEEFEAISEVLEVKTLGDNERLIEVIVNPRIVETYGLTSKDVISSISNSNLMIAAGTLSNNKGSRFGFLFLYKLFLRK